MGHEIPRRKKAGEENSHGTSLRNNVFWYWADGDTLIATEISSGRQREEILFANEFIGLSPTTQGLIQDCHFVLEGPVPKVR